MRSFVLAAAAAGVLAAACPAADLAKLERVLNKEPAYRDKPHYCLLVFGPEAKHRVWLVLDGDRLFVDRNGNGDLTDDGEPVQAPAFEASDHPAHERERTITVGDLAVGGCQHTDLSVNQVEYRRKVPAVKDLGANTAEEWQAYLDKVHRQVPGGVVYTVNLTVDPKCFGLFDRDAKPVPHFAWVDDAGQLSFAARAAEAPVVHFGGPITLRGTPDQKLARPGQPGLVTVHVGTPGVGAGSFATMLYTLVPAEAKPEVEIRFRAKEAGKPDVVRKYVLDKRC